MDSVESFHAAHEELRDWTPRLTSTARNLPSMTHGEREGAISGLLADLAAVDVHMRLDEHALFP
jgi:hypothetical protein